MKLKLLALHILVATVRLQTTGNKKDNITVIYTPWSNLKKDGSMAVGQVGFKDNKKASYMLSFHVSAGGFSQLKSVILTTHQVKRIHVVARENPIINRLNKTKVEKFPDLREEKEARLRELRKRDQGARDARVCPQNALSPPPVTSYFPLIIVLKHLR